MTVIVFSIRVCPIQMNNPNNGTNKNRASRIFLDLACNVSLESNIGQVIRILKLNEFIDDFVLSVSAPVHLYRKDVNQLI